jgi:hypothetical protein
MLRLPPQNYHGKFASFSRDRAQALSRGSKLGGARPLSPNVCATPDTCSSRQGTASAPAMKAKYLTGTASGNPSIGAHALDRRAPSPAKLAAALLCDLKGGDHQWPRNSHARRRCPSSRLRGEALSAIRLELQHDPRADLVPCRNRRRERHHGLGECFGPARPNAAVVQAMAAELVGKEALATEQHWQHLYNPFRDQGQKGLVITVGIDEDKTNPGGARADCAFNRLAGHRARRHRRHVQADQRTRPAGRLLRAREVQSLPRSCCRISQDDQPD